MNGGRRGALFLASAPLALLAGCGRTELETRGWHDYDAGRPAYRPDVVDAAPDEPDVGPEAEAADAEPDGEEDEAAPREDGRDTADTYEFTGLSCMSAAMCAMCCGMSDYGCMLGCVGEADPSSSDELMAIVGCIMGAGCGGDLTCMMEECSEEINACSGGPGGTGGCLGLAWCLVSSGCTGLTECTEQGLCYQTCFGAARPEVMGAARDLVICVAGMCMMECASGLTSLECIGCLATNCLVTLRGCVGL